MSLVLLRKVCQFYTILESARASRYDFHDVGVAKLSHELAKLVGVPKKDLEYLKCGAHLHDLGKSPLPATITDKPGRLTRAEWAAVQAHTIIGWEMFQQMGFADSINRIVLPIIRSHHEHYDGSGYPDGLKGDRIPLYARIVGIADAYDAISVDQRPYQNSGTKRGPIDILLEHAKHYDPRLLDLFIQYLIEKGEVAQVSAIPPPSRKKSRAQVERSTYASQKRKK